MAPRSARRSVVALMPSRRNVTRPSLTPVTSAVWLFTSLLRNRPHRRVGPDRPGRHDSLLESGDRTGSLCVRPGAYQRIATRSITACSIGAPDPASFAGSLRVASSVTSKPGSPCTAEVSRQPSR